MKARGILLGSIVFAISATNPTLAHTHEADPQWNCDDPQVQQEMNYCAHLEYQEADRLLNEQWAKTSAVMKLRDENWESTYDDRPGYLATVLAAQRAWITFRETHCASEGYLFRGGSMESLIVSSCKTTLTQRRTQQLRDLENLE